MRSMSADSGEALRARYDRASAGLDPPLALVDLDAFDRNAHDLTHRHAGRPIRVATKSLRCRYLIERALAMPGYRGVMCYSLPEALWLHAEGASDDLLVAYPTVDARALRSLAADDGARRHITIMVDSPAHLDVVDRALGDEHAEIRVCLELDVSWRPLGRRRVIDIGTRRSPLHTADQAVRFARTVIGRTGFRLVGLMGYEGQIAGFPDAPPGHPARARLIRLIQDRSARELGPRRADAVRQIQELTSLEFVNGGGTGSLESTAGDASVTELTAGSAWSGRRCSTPTPGSPRHRRCCSRCPWCAGQARTSPPCSPAGTSHPARTPDRLPRPYLPEGLSLTGVEGPARSRRRSAAPPPSGWYPATGYGCGTPRPAS